MEGIRRYFADNSTNNKFEYGNVFAHDHLSCHDLSSLLTGSSYKYSSIHNLTSFITWRLALDKISAGIIQSLIKLIIGLRTIKTHIWHKGFNSLSVELCVIAVSVNPLIKVTKVVLIVTPPSYHHYHIILIAPLSTGPLPTFVVRRRD